MDKISELVGSIPPVIQILLAGAGALYLGSAALSTLKFLLHVFVLSGLDVRKYGKKGTWAVVTGASDGIGKEFATQLASKGFNIVLVSRTQSKLEALASELESKYPGTQTKILAMDYAKDDEADYQRMEKLITGLDIGILINNVGQSHNMPVSFLETERNEMQNIVTINCMGTLKTTKVVAPILAQRKKGLILTVGSFAGLLPTPYLATYSGSKAFLQHWSSALAAELKPQGVDVHLLISYLVATALAKRRRTSAMIPGPKQFVRAALGKIGLTGPHNIANTYTPWWTHAVLQSVIQATVGVGSSIAAWQNLQIHQDIRRRALRKAEREAKKA